MDLDRSISIQAAAGMTAERLIKFLSRLGSDHNDSSWLTATRVSIHRWWSIVGIYQTVNRSAGWATHQKDGRWRSSGWRDPSDFIITQQGSDYIRTYMCILYHPFSFIRGSYVLLTCLCLSFCLAHSFLPFSNELLPSQSGVIFWGRFGLPLRFFRPYRIYGEI